MRLGRRQKTDGGGRLRLFYASDIHGSDLLWRKFLGAAKFYDAEAAVMGGDLLGKAIIPIARRPDGTYTGEFLGAKRVVHEGQELDEDALYERLKRLAEQLEDPQRAIFNLHVPPYDSRLDQAPDLKPDLTPRYSGGQPVMKPVGSHAVRRLIEEVQPLLALHGHIHESKGETRIGRTLALNSGSEYNTGRLHGAVVTLGDDRVVSHQFVVG